MFGDISIEWGTIVYPMMVLSYFELMRYLGKRYARKKPFADQEYLTNLARFMECSEYDIFMEAAKFWHVSTEQVRGDFKTYLLAEHIPYYVVDFLRKVGKDIVQKNYRRTYLR